MHLGLVGEVDNRHGRRPLQNTAGIPKGVGDKRLLRPRIGLYLCVQPLRLRLLLPPLYGEPRHLLREGLAVVFLRLRADVATGRQHVAVLANLFQRYALAETGGVGVLAGVFLFPPGVIGVGDAGDVLR